MDFDETIGTGTGEADTPESRDDLGAELLDAAKQPVERGIQKPAKPRHTARQPRDLPVEHVEKIGDDQRNANQFDHGISSL